VIERWLVAVRDHPSRPSTLQSHVLTMLALRMDWETGRGFAGVRDLMADAGVSKNTVMRATGWAAGSQLLLRTRRGHYINAQTTIASEWQLIQRPSGGTLGSQGPNGSNPKSQSGPPKVPVGTTHQESSSSPRASPADIIRAEIPSATDAEIEKILTSIRKHNPRNLAAYVRALVNNGDFGQYLPCDTEGPAAHSNACRQGDKWACAEKWCKCRCHTGQAVVA
jgi:hypothetical protein